jgi:hypothetical protein
MTRSPGVKASGRSKGSHLDRSDLRPYVGTWSKLRKLYPRWSSWPRGLRVTLYSTSFRLLRCIIFSSRMSPLGQFLPPSLAIAMEELASTPDAKSR